MDQEVKDLLDQLEGLLQDAFDYADSAQDNAREALNAADSAVDSADSAKNYADAADDQAAEARKCVEEAQAILSDLTDKLSDGTEQKDLASDVARHQKSVRAARMNGDSVEQIASTLKISVFLVERCLEVD